MQVIVLGMHRSGTSVLSKVLSNLGVNMGDGCEKPSSSNVEGHFEDERLIELNENILHRACGKWYQPPTIEALDSIENYINEQYTEYVNDRVGLWGVKEPRLSLLISYFSKHLTEPYYIFMQRDAHAVVNSLKVRDGMDTEIALGLKDVYDTNIKEFIKNEKNVLELCYENLIDNPINELIKICSFLNIPLNIEAVSHISTDKELLIKKRKVFNDVLKSAFLKFVAEPKKLYRYQTIQIFKSYLRKIIELYFTK